MTSSTGRWLSRWKAASREPVFTQITDAQTLNFPNDPDNSIAYFTAPSLVEPIARTYQGNVETGELLQIGESKWLGWLASADKTNMRAILVDAYEAADEVIYLWDKAEDGDRLTRKHLYGVPIEERKPGQQVPANGINNISFLEEGGGLLCTTALFDDAYGLGYIDLAVPDEVYPVKVTGTVHTGRGEMDGLEHLEGNRFLVKYNVDGCSWAYEGTFDKTALTMNLSHVICGQDVLSNGVLEAIHYDKGSDRYVLSFSTASSPTQIYTVEGADRKTVIAHTHERTLGIPEGQLSGGEDASFTSFDGLRVSARLYMPAKELGFTGPRPLIYYVHGGPQGQERPNFAWFSMPLIQFFTLNGFAVFVPNARGSTGYGLSYMKRVDHDWGGQDRLDHVHAMKLLAQDDRIDTSRAGVMGRSYGGYMTLTLASRNPELWSAAVDMFGPYNLITSIERFPEPWKPVAYLTIGHPEKDRDFLLERSPYTYIKNVQCPLLVMQGANDPRVLVQESRELVENRRDAGKDVEFVVFENEGHDVIKYENKVLCYNTIIDFFKKHLKP